jgi:hypothetical protein
VNLCALYWRALVAMLQFRFRREEREETRKKKEERNRGSKEELKKQSV